MGLRPKKPIINEEEIIENNIGAKSILLWGRVVKKLKK